jgi:glycosyltransferase involved in cell wall biosynthesis
VHILINDFIGGVLDRGIPLYVRNLIDGLRAEGVRVSVIRAPQICRKLPRNLFYLIAVLFEQLAVPLIGLLLRSDLTLYPYNSASLIDLVTGRGRIVVHDLEQLERPMSPSKIYYLACYRILKALGRPVFAISELTRKRLLESGLFGRGTIEVLPNTFYAFETLLRAPPPLYGPDKRILLCTGSTANKDLETVVSDHLPKVLAAGYGVTILGLHKTSDAPKLAALASFMHSGQLQLCGQLSDREVADEYLRHAVVWVHSLREGFGRCVVEGRLAGRRVLCTDIPEFASLRDGDVYLYGNSAELIRLLGRFIGVDEPTEQYRGYPYRDMLRQVLHVGAWQGVGSAERAN